MITRSVTTAARLIGRAGPTIRPMRSAPFLKRTEWNLSSVAPIHTSMPSGSAEQEAPIQNEQLERVINKLRRPMARKRRPIAPLAKTKREPSVVSIALAESFDLQLIAYDPAINGLFDVRYIDEEFDDCLYMVKKLEYTVNPGEISELFIFEDGVIVFWNVESAQRLHLIRDLERYTSGPYESKIVMDEQDRMPFSIVEGSSSSIKSDRFHLSKERHGAGNREYSSILERYAFSQGFAASVKIGVWEAVLSEMSEPLSSSTKSLKEGIIPWTRKEALMKSGEFAALRHSINLDCTLLNRDFYWERTHIEQYYNTTARHFTLNRRLTSLNSRLDYCEELVKMVDNMLALRHASTLEWMIIVLIVIEVIFDTFHFADNTPKKVIVVTEPALEPVSL